MEGGGCGVGKGKGSRVEVVEDGGDSRVREGRSPGSVEDIVVREAKDDIHVWRAVAMSRVEQWRLIL